MSFKYKFLDNLATKWLRKYSKVQELKKLGEKSDWKSTAKKCHDKISIDYRFWISKKDSVERSIKLTDITKDVAFMNGIEGKEVIDEVQLAKLKQICRKYGID